MCGKNKEALSTDKASFTELACWLQDGTTDGAERVANLGTKQLHDRNDDQSDQGDDDRVFNEPLSFFFWSE